MAAPSPASATETKAEAKEVEEHLEPLICKTWVLRVSIHCQGCKRKVKKVLRSIDGVYDINIDLRQQKVVVKGNVDVETLINKLIKTGKRAELWPEQSASKKKKKKKKKKKGKSENKQEQSDQESSEAESNQSGDNEKETLKVVVEDPAKNVEGCAVNVTKVGEGCVTGKGSVQFLGPKPEVRQIVTSPAGNQPPVLEKKVTIAVQGNHENEAGNENSGGGGGGGGSGGGKKKKKKGDKGNNNNGNGGVATAVEHPGDANQIHGQAHGPGPGPVPISSLESPPRHHIYHQYPPHHYAPAPPVHTVSCHTAYPPSTSSYGTRYYPSPQPYQYVQVRTGLGTDMEAPFYESESYTSHSQPSVSFEFLSDENPNGCSVM